MSGSIVLVDANLFIHAAPSSSVEPQKKNAAQAILKTLLLDSNITIAVTPLIRYEILRGTKTSAEFDELQQILTSITTFEISREIGDLATRLYKLRVSEGMNPDKYNFDIFHFATSKVLGLELKTDNSTDFVKLEEIFSKLA